MQHGAIFSSNACAKLDDSAKCCVCYLKGNSCVFLFVKRSDGNSKALWKDDINRPLLSMLTSVWFGDDLPLCGICSHWAPAIAGDIPVLLEKLQCGRGWAVRDYCVPGWQRRKSSDGIGLLKSQRIGYGMQGHAENSAVECVWFLIAIRNCAFHFVATHLLRKNFSLH